MLAKPAIPAAAISACLRDNYGLQPDEIAFLPLGADVQTAVYRVSAGAASYFLKLRRGMFDATAVVLPAFLSRQGVAQIIAPLPARSGQLWSRLDAYTTILYPFVAGRNGYAARMTQRHWRELATALRQIHALQPPPALAAGMRRESYAPETRNAVRVFLDRAQTDRFTDPIAAQLALLLQARRDAILALADRADALGSVLASRPLPSVICHGDLHAGNLLLASGGALHLVDWDEPVLAPRERDLMFVGGGLLASGLSPRAEEARFYATYGRLPVDAVALAYFRYERILQDIAAYCEQLFLTAGGADDRAQAMIYLASNFAPDGTIAIAAAADPEHG